MSEVAHKARKADPILGDGPTAARDDANRAGVHVLHLMSSAGFYGAENVCVELATAARSQGVASIVAAFDGSSPGSLEVLDVARGRGLSTRVISCRGRMDPRALRELRALLRREQIQIVHSHDSKANIYNLCATLGTATLAVATCHNWVGSGRRIRLYNVVDKISLRWFDRVVAVSNQVERDALRYGVPTGRVKIINNGVPLSRFDLCQRQSAQARADLGLPPGDRVVGTVARLSREKNLEMLLAAFALLAARQRRVTLLIVGDGPHRLVLEQQAERLGIARRVRFVGTQRDVTRALGIVDVFALTSLKEGLPMVVLEAMAARVPVISTPVGAVPAVLDHGRAGWLVEVDDVDGLATQLAEILSAPEAAARKVAGAYERVAARYSAERMAGDYGRVYREALELR